MSSVNLIVLMGRLGADPECRQTASGMAVTKFRMATDRFNGKERDKTTDWHSVVTFGRLAENCAQYLSKGSMCHVTGSVKYSTWEKQDGSTGYATDVIADDVKFVSIPSSAGNTNNGPAPLSGDEMPF